jgi:hypothetical protein
MTTIDYQQANRQLGEELSKACGELGVQWSISGSPEFREFPGKNYTAKAEAELAYQASEEQRKRKLTAVLFRPRDHTGNEGMQPRKKEGEAELVISIGSSVDGIWIPKLTCLELGERLEGGGLGIYKQVTSSEEVYMGGLKFGADITRPRRFDLTYDKIRGFGDCHLTHFNPALSRIASRDIDYQIAAFVGFQEQCEELGTLREAVRQGR